MKTRTLLLLAVACGLVILVAGSIKVFLVADADPPTFLGIGDTGRAGDMDVELVGVQFVDDQALATVSIGGVDSTNAGAAFGLLVDSVRLDSTAPRSESADEPCAVTVATAQVTCVVAFDTGEDHGLLLYDRAGETVRWEITADG